MMRVLGSGAGDWLYTQKGWRSFQVEHPKERGDTSDGLIITSRKSSAQMVK